MKPVAVIRHSPVDGPGYFGTFLSRRGVPWELVRLDAGDPVPQDMGRFSGLGLMGGPMSVIDRLPWMAPLEALIRAALAQRLPVLGHCLGGQLMASALGAPITRNPVKEIGWHAIQPIDHPLARAWFGDGVSVPVFQWHGDTFAIPRGATRLAGNPHCANQAFLIATGLALQCHIEMTADLVESWCDSGEGEIAQSPGPATQTTGEIRAQLWQRLASLHAVADRIYARWCDGLAAERASV